MLPAFAPGPVNALEPQIRALCTACSTRMVGHEFINGGTDYAQFIPPGVIARCSASRPRTRTSSASSSTSSSTCVDLPVEERIEVFEPIEEYFARQIEDHRRIRATT